MSLKIKEPDYKALYESRQAKIDSLNKTISGLKGRITRLENENKRLQRDIVNLDNERCQLIIENRKLKNQIESPCFIGRYSLERTIRTQSERIKELEFVKKQAEFIMRKIN